MTDNWFYPYTERIWLCIRFAKWAWHRLTEDADFGKKKKKKSSFQMKLILILATSKIITFGAQKTGTHTLKSRRTQNESLFGTNFDPEP